MKKVCILFSAALVLFSCMKEIAIPVDEFVPHPVVNALLCAGDSTGIWLSWSCASYDGSLPLDLNGAHIVIENAVRDTFQFTQAASTINSSALYVSALVPSEGENYTLHVVTEGSGTISSTTNVPIPVKIDSTRYTVVPGDHEGIMNIRLTTWFTDPPEENFFYYTFSVRGGEWWPCPIDSLNDYGNCFRYSQELFDLEWESDDPVFGTTGVPVAETIAVFDDELFNASAYGVCIQISVGNYSQLFNFDSVMVYSRLYSLAPDFYYYAKSLNQQVAVNGNPFFEPVTAYSNISNGYGIFAGMAPATDSVNITTERIRE